MYSSAPRWNRTINLLITSRTQHKPQGGILALGTLVAAIADLIYENGDIQVFAGYQLGADLALAFAAALIAGATLLEAHSAGEPDSPLGDTGHRILLQ